VPRGVMLNQPPIFLGGQGGMIGPLRLGYGTVILAGTVLRGDHPEGGKLLGQSGPLAYEITFHQGFYADVKRRVYNNISYIANILALTQWYEHVRRLFMAYNDTGRALLEGALEKLAIILAERLVRLQNLSEKMDLSVRIAKKIINGPQRQTLIRQSREFQENWPAVEKCLTGHHEEALGTENRDMFIQALRSRINDDVDYIHTIRGLEHEISLTGTSWLENIVDGITSRALEHLPACRN